MFYQGWSEISFHQDFKDVPLSYPNKIIPLEKKYCMLSYLSSVQSQKSDEL